MDDAARLKKRFAELAEQSERNNCYYFTDFLSPADASLVYELGRTVADADTYAARSAAGAQGEQGETAASDLATVQTSSRAQGETVESDLATVQITSSTQEEQDAPSADITLWGGHAAAERVIARFGNADAFGYEQPFPIAMLAIEPIQEKFADSLMHRDFLGALMHLGVERDVLGDIYVRGKAAYLFAAERMADYIIEGLHRVRHTDVRVRELPTLPDDCAPHLREATVILASPRLDGLVAKLHRLSRSEAKALFARQEIFINGHVCTNPAQLPKDGDVISVRHHGKWIFRGISRATKKGNEVARVEVYE